MNGRRSPLAMLLLVGLVPVASGVPPEKKASPPAARGNAGPARHRMPRLLPGQLWITSVPAGLEVRVGKNPLDGKVLGRTPLLVAAADRPQFVTVALVREEYGAPLPPQLDLGDFTAETTHSGSRQEAGRQVDYLRAITYGVKPGRSTVIALFQPRSLPLSGVARLFPAGSNFEFEDGAATKLLMKQGVTAPDAAQAIGLLHRGGKVVARVGGSFVVAEVTAPGVVSVFDLASLLPAPRATPERTP